MNHLMLLLSIRYVSFQALVLLKLKDHGISEQPFCLKRTRFTWLPKECAPSMLNS